MSESGDFHPSSTGERTIVDDWFEPLPDPDAPCGADLEYDNTFLELAQAATGKPETQFAPAEPPDWRQVHDISQSLFERTRDLRVAMHWGRAHIQLNGFRAVSDALRLQLGLLDRFWDTLHPQPDPDDGDAYARLNVLALLGEVEGMVGDVRSALVIQNRSIGELRVRDIEVMMGKYPPRDGETPMTRHQVEQMLAAATAQNAELPGQVTAALANLKALSSLLNDHVGIERAPDVRPLHNLFSMVNQVMPTAGAGDEAGADAEDGAQASSGDGGSAPRASGKGLSGAVDSRADALRAIDMVCDYLERTEPTNPAQLLLRRARRLINKNFLQLMRELAPDALNEVARIMGVDPESIQSEDVE
ncbi:MAG: type VI secretion system protein TssA [Aquabacterium sp.]|uniref:type VI secretion system protein TssA n=1 Tax=Aquabacterium sp. TaxID=1872578 RepID=UPI002721862B|nr:type VI secretion system protein TssA [Aquabacterium sp.]MDO9002382.1 type VI secretion system protein TssA [Aquabacterium sp.]